MFKIFKPKNIKKAARAGATIVTMRNDFDFTEMLQAIETYKVTVAHLVPTIINGIVKHPAVADYDLSSVQ